MGFYETLTISSAKRDKSKYYRFYKDYIRDTKNIIT